MSDRDTPACQCTAHPAGDDKRKYMIAVEETADRVVWCCRRCTEITHTAVIQVRTLPHGVARARYRVDESRRQMDPRLRRMLDARKRGGARIQEDKHTHDD